MKTYPNELKAQVIAERNAGASWKSLSARYEAPIPTIRHWVQSAPDSTLKTTRLSAYDWDAMALRLVDGSVSAVGSIQRITTNEKWIAGQNAHDLAILYGVIADKLYRLLNAVRRSPGDSGPVAIDTGADRAGPPLPG